MTICLYYGDRDDKTMNLEHITKANLTYRYVNDTDEAVLLENDHSGGYRTNALCRLSTFHVIGSRVQ